MAECINCRAYTKFNGGLCYKCYQAENDAPIVKSINMRVLLVLTLIYFNSLALFGQKLDWVQTMEQSPATFNASSSHFCSDSSGNIYVSGFFKDDLFLPLSTYGGTFTSNASSRDIYISKFTPTGALVWVKTIGGLGNDLAEDIVYSEQNNTIYIGGKFTSSMDFDPGPGNYNLAHNGSSYYNAYLLQLDTAGNFINVSNIGYSDLRKIGCDTFGNIFVQANFSTLGKFDEFGTLIWEHIGYPNLRDFAIHTDGSIYSTGIFNTTTDFDFGTTTYSLNPQGSYHLYVLKEDGDGNFISVNELGNDTINVNVDKLRLSQDGSIFLAGAFNAGALDVDFFGNGSVLYGTSSPVRFLSRYDDAFNPIWYTVTETGVFADIFVDESNHIITTANVDYGMDINPGPGEFYANYNKYCLFQLDENGNYEFGYFSYHGLNEVIGGNDFLYTTGSVYPGKDADPSIDQFILEPNTIGSYLSKIDISPCNFDNLNIDSLIEPGCSGPGSIAITFSDKTPLDSISWSTGQQGVPSIIVSTEGLYSVTVTDTLGCSDSMIFIIHEPVTDVDATVNVVPLSYPSVGTGSFILLGNNLSCTPTDGQIKISSNYPITYLPGLGEYYSGDTVLWDFTNLSLDSALNRFEFGLDINWPTPTDSIRIDVSISTTVNDVNPNNNERHYEFASMTGALGQYKMAHPVGQCTANYVDTSETLTYTIGHKSINFYNNILGNYYVIDTLDPNLDPGTLNILSHTGNMYLEYLDSNVVKFGFYDSPLNTTAYASDHLAYVIYEINMKPGTNPGTIIKNVGNVIRDHADPDIINTNVETFTAGDITLMATSFSSQTVTACDFYNWNTTTYTTSGVYTQEFQNIYGCDSIVEVDLTIQSSSFQVLDTVACDNIDVNGITYTASGNYTQYLVSSEGCDSTLTINFELDKDTANLNISVCDSFSLNNITYSNAGTYFQTVPSMYGCDSTIILNLEILSTEAVLNVTALYGYVLNNVLYTSTGTYYQVLTNSNGCDSTITLNLTLSDVGIGESSFLTLKAYPNPFNDYLKIKGDVEISELKLWDNTGRELQLKTGISQKDLTIDTHELNAGVYYLLVATEAQSFIIKVIKHD